MNVVKCNQQDIIPSKVICIGRNYVEHIQELNNEIPSEQDIFLKPNSAIANELLFNPIDAIHYEGEICFLVKSEKLFAVGFGLDLTKREIQSTLKAKGLPWERAKAFDASAVFSDFVEFNGDCEQLSMELHINDLLIQKATYDLMLHKPESILNEIKSFLSLEDGDIIMTGTPKGVGAVQLGDRFTGKIYHNDQLIVTGEWLAKV
jgi:2-keto-4-pentenoate hydratase/2-oxohepta-3-ene-1,7-dioic acid hydratase in catechol pathway